jgi:hypothetical protein
MARNICTVDGCGKFVQGHGFCTLHYKRWRKGTPFDVGAGWTRRGERNGNWSESPSYGAIHQRLYIQRGSASKQPCVDCGQQAKDWSYNKSGVGETEGVNAQGRSIKYSTDLDQYEPRCALCHRRLDFPKPPIPDVCREGHSLLGENVYLYRGKWVCRACRKKYQKEYDKKRRLASGTAGAGVVLLIDGGPNDHDDWPSP